MAGEKTPSSSASKRVSVAIVRSASRRGERAVDDPDEGDDAAVLVVGGVEDERAGGCVEFAGRRGHPLDDRVEDVGDAVARLGGDAQHVGRVVAEQIGDLDGRPVRVGCGEVDLVRDGDDLEPVLDREVGVRERLRLDTLRGVDHEQRALAGLQRARDLVREVDMPGRVDEVELVALPGDADGLGLDRDAALPLELHRVEDLLAHLARRDGLGQLEDAVRERRLAVVDVRDDREVADVALVHPAAMVLAARWALGAAVGRFPHTPPRVGSATPSALAIDASGRPVSPGSQLRQGSLTSLPGQARVRRSRNIVSSSRTPSSRHTPKKAA